MPAAFNQSIYLMVSVPYISFGNVGFLIYRGCKKNAAYLQALDEETPTGGR
jgi:hypothetical protein